MKCARRTGKYARRTRRSPAGSSGLPPTASPRSGKRRNGRSIGVGITFAVYGEEAGTERLIPFDLVPRIISGDEWKVLDRGPEAARAGA